MNLRRALKRVSSNGLELLTNNLERVFLSPARRAATVASTCLADLWIFIDYWLERSVTERAGERASAWVRDPVYGSDSVLWLQPQRFLAAVVGPSVGIGTTGSRFARHNNGNNAYNIVDYEPIFCKMLQFSTCRFNLNSILFFNYF